MVGVQKKRLAVRCCPCPDRSGLEITDLHADGKSYAGRDVLWHRRDGSTIEARIWTAPLHDAQGAFIGMLATAADMTESKRADEALRERERFIRTIIDSMPALIACVGPDERYRFNNKAFETWFGRSLTSLRGRRVQEVVGEATYSEIRHHIQAALSGRAVHFECLVPHGKNGDMRHLSVNYVPDITRDGSVKGFFDLMIDITERRRAKEALQLAGRRP